MSLDFDVYWATWHLRENFHDQNFSPRWSCLLPVRNQTPAGFFFLFCFGWFVCLFKSGLQSFLNLKFLNSSAWKETVESGWCSMLFYSWVNTNLCSWMDFLLCDVFPMNFEEKDVIGCNIPLDVKGLEG